MNTNTQLPIVCNNTSNIYTRDLRHFLQLGGGIPYIKYPNTKSYNPNLLPVESEKVGNCITIDLWTSSGHIQSHQRLMFLIDKPEK